MEETVEGFEKLPKGDNTVVWGDYVAVEPFPKDTVESSGMAIARVKADKLVKLKVVYQRIYSRGEDEFEYLKKNINYVYVMAEHAKSPWATRVFTVNDKQFIVVPMVSVVLVELEEGVHFYP